MKPRYRWAGGNVNMWLLQGRWTYQSNPWWLLPRKKGLMTRLLEALT